MVWRGRSRRAHADRDEPVEAKARRTPSRWGIVAVPVLQFAVAGTAAVVIVGLATSVASRRVGEREAIVDARTRALVKAQGIVEPLLTRGIIDGDRADRNVLGQAVTRDVLDGSLVRVKLWEPDGTIVYSDEPRLIGARYALGEEERDAIDDDTVEAEVSDLSRPENRFERSQRKLLEVYLPVRDAANRPLLFEAYFRYQAVEDSGNRVWRSFAPITLGALLVLELVQLPLAWSLASRLRSRQLERERLLNRVIGVSEQERRRIAQDLHDGVVQDLAGVSYALSGMDRAEGSPAPGAMEDQAAVVRRSIEALRTLLVEIYPPDLASEGLGPALTDLLSRTRAAGLDVRDDLGPLDPSLSLAGAGLLYRTVQEALRNVLAHADATTVRVRAASEGARTWVEVEDDGRGFDPADARTKAGEGHLGLAGLAGLAGDAGGELQVTSAPGAGTTVRMEVPTR